MHESFRAFAEGLIDYAGMFPPAELPMVEALRNHLRYLRGNGAWMIGRFISPAARLEELLSTLRGQAGVVAHEPVESGDSAGTGVGEGPGAPSGQTSSTGFEDAASLRVSALGRSGEDAADWVRGFRSDLDAIERCHARPASSARIAARAEVRVEVLEARVPAVAPELLDGLRDALQDARNPDLRIYLEIPGGGDWRSAVTRSAETIAAHNAAQAPPHPLGFKLRCGGVTADAFPSIEEVAEAIDACRVVGVSFKATAGLHHPVRSVREEVGAKMHGFVNVFGAALLAHEHRLGTRAIAEILAEEDSGAFRFSADAFAWRDLSVSAARIRSLRREAVTSFGSCSFDEPREDLRSLGLLDEDPARTDGSKTRHNEGPKRSPHDSAP